MHFLCLHGAGTNSQIFEIQTALRYELGGNYSYEFVEGVIPCDMFPGLQDISTSDDEYFAYYEPNNRASFSKAMSDLKTYIAEEGPFDGVLAFSQGSSLAAAIIMEWQRSLGITDGNSAPTATQPFRCAVFLSGRLPYIDAGGAGYFQLRGTLDHNQVISIPTVHVWGANDTIEPEQHSALSEICKKETRHIFVHEGGHEVPGLRNKDSLTDSANVIKRMLARIDSI